jgi:ABC-type polysaccharide/polyol phosphate export permease/GT2 family glycosyltransferase
MTTTRATPLVSIVIPTSNRLEWLRRCLTSLAAQRDAPDYELLVCAPPDPEVRTLVTSLVPGGTVVSVPDATPAERRNAVLPLARGELVLFLDDDVEVPEHYLATLASQSQRHPDVQVFGGPNVTPQGSTNFQTVQGAVLSSLFGAGPARRRYGPHPPAEADERWFTLCNLAIRRTHLTSFDADLVCAEENELLDRLRRSGVRMRYEPELWAAHDRRPDLRGFSQQMFKYGRGRGQLARRSPRTLRPAHLVPTATMLVIVALAIAASATGQAWLAAPIAAYPLAVVVQGAKVATTLRRPPAWPAAIGLTAVLHACYGLGLAIGLLEPATGPARATPMGHSRMLRILVRRQLLMLRKRSALGLLWPLLTPWVMLALYSFVFHSVLNIPIPRYRVYLFAGLLPWAFFSQTAGTAVTSLSFEADLIRRSRFPYSLLPLATEIAASTYFLATLTAFVGYLGVSGHLNWAVLPAILIPVASLYCFVGAIACVLALVDVYNRDLRQMLNNILTVWFFLVPIVYRQKALSHGLLFLRSVDPLNLIIGQFRDVLYYGHLSRPLHDAIVLAATVVLLFLATGMIKRFSPSLPKDV